MLKDVDRQSTSITHFVAVIRSHLFNPKYFNLQYNGRRNIGFIKERAFETGI